MMFILQRPIRLPLAICLAGLLLSLSIAGCSGGQAASNGPDDARLLNDAVENFNEARMSTKQSEKLFVQGALPEKGQFKKYGEYSYWPNVGGPSISGDSATMRVAVRNEKTGVDAGQVEWAFKKEGSGWKIAKAPLP